MSNHIFNKGMQKIKKIYHKKLPAMISLELIFVIGVLGFIVQKMISLVNIWIQKFYLMYGTLLVVNSYLQLPNAVETSINQVQISSNKKENTLTITGPDKHIMEALLIFLKSRISTDNNNYQIIQDKETIEVTLN